MELDFGPGTSLTSGPKGGLGGVASKGGLGFSGALSIAGIGLNLGSAIASGNTKAIVGTVVGGVAGGALGGALAGTALFPGVGTVIGALMGASLGSSVGGMFGKGGGGGGHGDAAAIAANANATANAASVMGQINSYKALESQLPALLAYAGQSREAIQQTITNQRQQLGKLAYDTGLSAQGYASGAGVHVGLFQEAYKFGYKADELAQTAAYGTASLTPYAMPEIDPNFVLVQPRTSGVDYTQGGDKFVFHPEAPGAEYTAAQEIGTKAINRQLAARGLYNSEAGIETLSRFNQELAGQEEQRQYANRQQEYGEVMAANLGERANQQDIFGRLVASTGLNQEFALEQQKIGANMQTATLQAQTQLAESRGQLDFENAQFGYTQNQNAINRAQNQVYSGIGSYYQAEQAGRTNQLTDAMTLYYRNKAYA